MPYRPHAKGSIRIRHAPNLRSADRTVREAIPVTSVSRTLLDLAAVLTRPRLDRVLEQAERLRRLDRRRLEEALTRSPTRHGTRRLRAALDLYIEPEPTRSELERSFLDLVRAAGLRSPSVNAAIGGYEVDFLWRDERMAVELDGFEFHGTRAAFERDRARDHDLQMEGIQVVRLTWRRLRDDGAEVAERLGEALRRNRIERGERKR